MPTVSEPAGRPAVLVFSGSFNPVHTEHLRILEVARAWAHDAGWAVHLAFLCPSNDRYVDSKCLTGSLPLSERIRLCAVATAEVPWVTVWHSGEPSSHRVAREIVRSLSGFPAAHLSGSPVTTIEVMGSDAAERVLRRIVHEWRLDAGTEPWYVDRLICCVARPNHSTGSRLPSTLEELNEPLQAIGLRVTAVDPTRFGVILRDVSSTRVRRLVAEGDWAALVSQDLVDQRVLEVLRAQATPTPSAESL